MRTVLPQIVELYEIIADTIHTLTTSREPSCGAARSGRPPPSNAANCGAAWTAKPPR
ncbi:MAG: hypothetical protein ACLTTU_01790 [Bilophila wadsworthia]